MPIIYSLHTHHIFAIHSIYIFYTPIIYSLYTHHIFATCPSYICYTLYERLYPCAVGCYVVDKGVMQCGKILCDGEKINPYMLYVVGMDLIRWIRLLCDGQKAIIFMNFKAFIYRSSLSYMHYYILFPSKIILHIIIVT